MSEAAIDWNRIDTVLLDMDGTLLDLRFDNWFWQELIPIRYADLHGLSTVEAQARLEPKFRAKRGTIEWYCIDFWSRELGLDIAAIKRAARARAGYLPGALGFLHKLAASGKRRVLVTNAHPTTLAIKNERLNISPHFDACYSTHAFDAPKEHPEFWPRLHAREPFNAGRTLFVDDSLPVLEAAHGFGVGWLRAVRRPDSKHPAQPTGKFAGVDRVADLIA
jgi:putative hydrolase of the HAD superfamily